MEELKGSPKVVGMKQVLRGLKEGSLKSVYVANDADTFLYQRVVRTAEAANIPVTRVASKQELGKASGVEVAAAAVGLLR